MHTNTEQQNIPNNQYSSEDHTTPQELFKPAFAPVDYHKVQTAINDCIADIHELLPAFSKDQKMQLQRLIGGVSDATIMGIDEVTNQYQLVLRIRDMVLDGDDHFYESTTAKDLSALVNSISNLISLYLKHQVKLDQLRDIAVLREAVVDAVRELPMDVQTKFFAKLEELNER